MISISALKGGGKGTAQYYFEDYFQDSDGKTGKWFGPGAELLDLTGSVDIRHFKSVLAGYAPGGKSELVKNAGSSSRQVGWDNYFKVEKSESTLYALSSPKVQAEIEKCIQRVTEKTLNELERGPRARVGSAPRTSRKGDRSQRS